MAAVFMIVVSVIGLVRVDAIGPIGMRPRRAAAQMIKARHLSGA
jgi:hypothetical protein